MARRTGRRPGNPDTRDAILASARELFAERGYDGTSIRAIAAEAKVDPALVHHYFGTKEQLFVATVQAPIDPGEILPKILAGGEENLAERLVRTFLSVWESPVTGPAMIAMLRSAVANQLSARLVREFFAIQVARRLMRVTGLVDIDPAEIPLRASLVASQLFGMGLLRYLLKFEPLASAPTEAVVAAIAPNIHRYLRGDLGDLGDLSGAAEHRTDQLPAEGSAGWTPDSRLDP